MADEARLKIVLTDETTPRPAAAPAGAAAPPSTYPAGRPVVAPAEPAPPAPSAAAPPTSRTSSQHTGGSRQTSGDEGPRTFGSFAQSIPGPFGRAARIAGQLSAATTAAPVAASPALAMAGGAAAGAGGSAVGGVAGAAAGIALAGALGPIGIAAAAAAAGLYLAGKALGSFNRWVNETADRLAKWSGELATAQARAEIISMQADRRRALALGSDLAKSEVAGAKIGAVMSDLGTQFAAPFVGIWAELKSMFSDLLSAVKPLLSLMIEGVVAPLRLVNEVLKLIHKVLIQILEWIGLAVEKEKDHPSLLDDLDSLMGQLRDISPNVAQPTPIPQGPFGGLVM